LSASLRSISLNLKEKRKNRKKEKRKHLYQQPMPRPKGNGINAWIATDDILDAACAGTKDEDMH